MGSRVLKGDMPSRIDISGKRIGRVIILERDQSKPRCLFWKAVCDCGTHFSCYSASFKRGERFECKECMLERRRGIDLTGRKYGRWTVVGMGVNHHNKTVCHCLCDCGKTGDVTPYTLSRPRHSMSCGCYGRKLKSKYVNSTLYPPAHGLSQSSFYSIRIALIHKCYKIDNPSYRRFGAKGITVCELWRNGAKDMYEWALSIGWKEKDVFCLKEDAKEFNPDTVYLIPNDELRSIIGLNGGVQITYRGETHSVGKWAKILGVNKGQLRRKIAKNPSVEEVFGSHFKKNIFAYDPSLTEKVIKYYQEGKTCAQIGILIGVSQNCVRYNLIKNDIELRAEFPLKKPEVRNEDIIKMTAEGMSISVIAKKLGVSTTSIYHRIEKINGVKRDRSKG